MRGKRAKQIKKTAIELCKRFGKPYSARIYRMIKRKYILG